jgi:hypothetical protein
MVPLSETNIQEGIASYIAYVLMYAYTCIPTFYLLIFEEILYMSKKNEVAYQVTFHKAYPVYLPKD